MQLIEDIGKIKQVRRNIYSIYSRISTIFVLLIMVVLAGLSTIYVPYYLKEYSIPAILRLTNDNLFFSTMRIRSLTYACFIISAGCLPHLHFYNVRDNCLHTNNSEYFGLLWTDRYFYSLVTLLWFVSVPIILFYLAAVSKDQTRFMFVPFMVASIVFMILITVFGTVVIVFALFDGNDVLTQASFAFCIAVLIYSVISTTIYRIRYSRRDLVRSDEEEI